MEKRFVKGFKLDRQKVAELANVEDRTNPEVDAWIRTILNSLNRNGYKFIGAVYDRPPDQSDHEDHLAIVIVLEEGGDLAKLRTQELGLLDESIEAARPHVLVGPDVWELWG